MIQICKRICPKRLRKPLGAMLRKIRFLWYKVYMYIFPGKAVYRCPCCGLKLRSFVAGGYIDHPEVYNPKRYENTRQDVICPACYALPRHRILAAWCEAHIDELRCARILYFAPEYSMMLWMKRNGLTCTTADLNASADLRLDIQNTGLPDESYDAIICNHVLEHVDDFRAALREVYRILRRGGTFICSFPMDVHLELLDEEPEIQTDEGRLRRFGQIDHQRVFGMKADRFLEEAGFVVKRIAGDDWPDEILPVVGPADYDMNILFKCVK